MGAIPPLKILHIQAVNNSGNRSSTGAPLSDSAQHPSKSSAGIGGSTQSKPNSDATTATKYQEPSTNPPMETSVRQGSFLKALSVAIYSGTTLERSNVIPNQTSASAYPQTLSETSILLSRLVAASKQKLPDGAIIDAKEALTDSDSVRPDKMARSLELQISKSGLFYESHLRQWIEGTRPLDDVEGTTQQIHKKQNSIETHAEQTLSKISIMDSDALTWNGHPWHGQKATINIEHNPPEDNKKINAEPSQAWSTTIKINLPNLGSIEASIFLSETGSSITIASDESSRDTLFSEFEQLQKAIESSVGFAPYVALER